MSSQGQSSSKRIVYQEFSSFSNSKMLENKGQDLLPEQQDIRIQLTRSGRKGKTVTVITGFQHSAEKLAKLLKQFKSRCGSGGTIKDNILEIQGDHCQKLITILSQLGYKVKISGG
ncbi:translation initiation factor [Cyanobacterium sp. uoEpiScrs1]|uniref:translation initiation factor n=1 Tax=Cyanobacterium sp. uoEpiScrs1 TaxID=2976343 RepID=UPI00226A75E5|nr:translation initiation factor [Cyanobacterium sp. uoEpiScrs1]